jgi:hypothetical protein
MGITITPGSSSTSFDGSEDNKSFLTQEARFGFLNNFKSSIDNDLIALYAFYGRPTPFDPESPADFPLPTNAILDNLNTRKSITALRKIRKSETRVAFKKYVWTTGTVYSQYSNRIDLSSISEDEPFYVIADNGKVYKCIDNNNGAASINKPDSQDTGIFNTDDGYKWKLLISYGASTLIKFDTETHLPLPAGDDDVIKSKDGGQVDRIDFKDSNASKGNYPNLSEVPFFVDGDGDTSTTAFAEMRITNTPETGALQIDNLELTSGGADYFLDTEPAHYQKVPVKFRLKTSELQVSEFEGLEVVSAYGLATINQVTRTVESVEVIDPGAGYITGAKVQLVQSSSIIYGKINNNELTTFDIIKAGNGFKSASLISVINRATGSAVTAADDNLNVIISPPEGHAGNLQKELNASSLFINVRISAQSGDFTTGNDFRQVGIIQNPLKFNNSSDVLTDTTADAKYSCTLVIDDSSTVEADDIIEGQVSGTRAILIDFKDTAPNERVIRYILSAEQSSNARLQAGETVLINGKTFTVKADSLINPEFDAFSGDILFINNSDPIQRELNQIETLNFIIEF